MTAVASVIPTTIDRLYTILTAALPSVAVVKGPGVTDASLPSVLWIGWSDPDAEGLDEAASSDIRWAWLGTGQRAENATVNCVADAWNGDGDLGAARDTVFGVVNQVATAIQSDPTLGLQGSPVAGINLLVVQGVQLGSFLQDQNEDGAYARLQFGVDVQGRVS